MVTGFVSASDLWGAECREHGAHFDGVTYPPDDALKAFCFVCIRAALHAAPRIVVGGAVGWEGASLGATLAARCRSSRCGDHAREWPRLDCRGRRRSARNA